MRSRSCTPGHGVRGLLLAGAVAMGAVGWFPLHAQESGPLTKGTGSSDDKATGQPATATPQARLREQQLATRRAKATYEIARLIRELAELSVEEYGQTVFPRDQAAVEGEIKLAESDLARAEDRRKWAGRMFEKKYVSKAVKISEELSFKRAQFSLEQAQSKRAVLLKYSKAKTIKELKSEVEKARADELARREAWEQEKVKETHLERQLGPVTN